MILEAVNAYGASPTMMSSLDFGNVHVVPHVAFLTSLSLLLDILDRNTGIDQGSSQPCDIEKNDDDQIHVKIHYGLLRTVQSQQQVN